MIYHGKVAMILRRLARPMLASIFIFGGIGSLRDPSGHAQAAAPVLDKTAEKAGEKLPENVPTDQVTMVRVDGAVKIAAGSLLALGKFPRFSAAALLTSLTTTTAGAHRFWEARDEGEKQQQLTQFLKNLSLAGGLLLAVADTEGKPSLGWRARRAAAKAGHHVSDTAESARDSVHGARVGATHLAGRAATSVQHALPG
jgi:putative oxidoreductase